MSLKYVCSHVVCVLKSHHNIWWKVVVKGLQNFVIPLLQLLVQSELHFLCCVFFHVCILFDRVFGRGWIKSGESCYPEGLR